jgi:hypothetical protein
MFKNKKQEIKKPLVKIEKTIKYNENNEIISTEYRINKIRHDNWTFSGDSLYLNEEQYNELVNKIGKVEINIKY